MTSVVVTGANGFLGRHVVAALMNRGLAVHALIRSPQKLEDALPPGAMLHQVDLFSPSAVVSALDTIRPSGLVHLAWEATPGTYWNAPVNESWRQVSLDLFKTFSHMGGGRILVAGTSAEYDWNTLMPLDETASPLQPQTLYGRMKNMLRMDLEKLAADAGLTWAWGRLFNIFGPYEKPERLVPRTILSLLSGQPAHFDDGLTVRDFMHVADAAAAFSTLYTSSFNGPVNIASGTGISIRALLTAIATEMGCPDRLVFEERPLPSAEPPCVVGATRRLNVDVGWSEGIGWRRGVQQTVQWWKHAAANISPPTTRPEP
jgi:nucleoside-diphosphate-sugar epimerase